MRKLLSFIFLITYVSAVDYAPSPPKDSSACCAVGQYLKKDGTIVDAPPYYGSIQYAVKENLPSIHNDYPSTCVTTRFWRTVTADYGGGYYGWVYKQNSNACVAIPDCTATQPGTVWSSESETCVEPPPPLPCENPQLIRDANGTCACPDSGENFDSQYDTCLSDGACPSEPTTTIYTDGICYRWFYDCIGFDKATETAGLTADECKNPVDPANDTDDDGIPDALDDDMDGDGIPNNTDPDIDGDGVPNSSDSDSNRGPETNSTAPSEDMCRLQDPNSYRNGNQCSCNTGYTKVDGVCKKPDNPKDPCNYPSVNSNFDFQGLTLNRSTCVEQYTYWSNNGTGITAKLETCEKYGCYYNTGANNGDVNISDTSVGTGEDLDGDGEADLTDGQGGTGDENELNKEDASVLGELLGDALSNIVVSDVLVVSSSGPPPPSKVTIMGEQYTLFDVNKIPPEIWETMQTLFKFMAIIAGIVTVFTTI